MEKAPRERAHEIAAAGYESYAEALAASAAGPEKQHKRSAAGTANTRARRSGHTGSQKGYGKHSRRERTAFFGRASA